MAAATAGIRAAISRGIETTPWQSAYSKSPARTARPKISTGSPNSTMCMYAWETETAEANIGNCIRLTPGMSRTAPLVMTPSQWNAFRMAACTSPTVDAPASRGVQVLDDGDSRNGEDSRWLSHQSVRSDVGVAGHGRIGRADPAGRGVAEQAGRSARHATQTRGGEALVPQPDPELFDCIGDRAGIELPDGVEDLGGRFHFGARKSHFV